MRILDRSTSVRYLDSIGMASDDLTLYREMIAKPYGLILVTGPSGSGKTTTLYGTLNELKEFRGNVMTCEDPVEYEIDGISQSQVQDKVGLSFASHLRAVMRQDPDVILVGEIRDTETAQTALRAALTGHLVLSTLHANSAPAAIPRLIDLGLESRLLASCLIGVTAQRLVRTLCSCCRIEETDEDSLGMLEYMGAPPMTHHRAANGCRKCGLTGYFGRAGVHEILPIKPGVAAAFEGADAVEQMMLRATPYGYRSMQDRAIELLQDGRTTIREVMSAISFDRDRPGRSSAPSAIPVDANEAWLEAMRRAMA
jgi:type II secretory ATPase GspE/PulE/Tfp pilus assembly ATPase PilB-like protein